MSWQAYVDNNLVATGKVTKGAIFGLDGSLWATTPGFAISGAEAKKLIAAFEDVSDVAANGIFLEGVKFFFLRNPENSIYARNGATGITVTKTGQAIIVGYYNENQQAGDCNNVVEGLATYLIGHGY
ncbi:profilin, required for normal timing of actin polymerization in response to thermal stress [Linnemannia exigua]|uniref:Profilin n=1 Tax=Linnemannia exigua TaxID=604196 RepID=A0AAD4DMI0_9FUNG|nr:profilin, required for normal timing of actin polymerization in response to thermal stress [Linnemannia exigua]